MYEELNKINKKMVIATSSLFIICVFIVFMLNVNLFGFVDMIADKSLTTNDIKLYGSFLFGFCGLAGFISLLRALRDTPMKSLQKFANKTEYPDDTLKKLLDAWFNGEVISDICHMNDEYIIAFLNGANAKIIPLENVVWLYKTTTRYAYLIKTGSILNVRYANANGKVLQLKEKTIDLILDRVLNKNLDVVIGWDDDVLTMYSRKKDFDAMREYAHQQRIN